MISLRHFHLGGGEALRSTFDYLRVPRKQQSALRMDKVSKPGVQSKRGKQH